MTPAWYRFLRLLIISFGIAHLVAVSLAQFVFSEHHITESINPVKTPVMWWHDYIMCVLLMLIGLVLAFRLKQSSYHLFLAGFLICFAASFTVVRAWYLRPPGGAFIEATQGAVTGAIFIYSMMRFAGRHSPEAYGQYFLRRKRPGWYKRAVMFFSKDRPFWFLLFPVIAGFLISSLFIGSVVSAILNVLILIIGLIYFRISFYFAGSENRNRLWWLLWGLTATIVLYLMQFFLWLFYPELKWMALAAYGLTSLVVCLAFIMSIFFFRSTDARFVVRKTVIYGAIFLAGLFVFGAVEHYVIHTIAHALHLQSSILNSCFGAAMALMIRPLHHKVEHWLGRRGMHEDAVKHVEV